MCTEEVKKHVIDIDTVNPAGINAFKPGYICDEDDVIVGLQTDKPLKRIVNPYGGIRMVHQEDALFSQKHTAKAPPLHATAGGAFAVRGLTDAGAVPYHGRRRRDFP